MTAAGAEYPFTLKRAQALLGLSRTVVSGLIDAGFVTPARGARNEFRFSFRDLMLLRTAHALQQARIPPRKILRSLHKLKSELPAALPLTGLRITAVGADVTVRDRTGQWVAESGQLLMDFEVEAVSGDVSFMPARTRAAVQDGATGPGGKAPASRSDAAPRSPADRTEGGLPSPMALFREGETLEGTDAAAAESRYRRALELMPGFASAYLNLGALLCEVGRCDDAVALYREALDHAGDDPLIHFNFAIALEDQSQWRDALMRYERAIELDPTLADAHFNAGRLLEMLGDARGALRHFSAYRRLDRSADR